MTKNNPSHSPTTSLNPTEAASGSDSKEAGAANKPLSAQPPLIAINTILLVIFVHLAETEILSFSHARNI